jgi:uncharacterized protein (TIGR02145 family)
MTKLNKISLIISIIPLLFCLSCKKLELTRITKVTTGTLTDTKQTSCTAKGSVIEISEAGITQHGHCWSTQTNPSTNDSITQLGSRSSTGTFTSNLSGLKANTTYYIRAYAVDHEGTTYGNEVNFNTLTSVPSLITSAPCNITANSATCGGNINDDGGEEVTARGVCWSTSQNPTVNDSYTTDGGGTGSFVSSLTGLLFNTIYYVRAYAINNAGTTYGNEVSFTTLPVFIPSVTTDFISNITANSATCGGNVTDDGGATVTARGICWSISQNPTVDDSHANDISDTGSYSINLTGLSGNITYYVRAYATNIAGTTYGSQLSFTTETGITDTDGNTYNTIQIGSQLWMQENLKTTRYNDGEAIPLVTDNTTWWNLTTPAYCWFLNNIQVYKDVYGALYNWHTVGTGKLCPIGWHVPSDAEWTVLTDYLGGNSMAGGKMKETGTTHWRSPNTGATNETGFTALPGGYRGDGGGFMHIENYGNWWSANEIYVSFAWIYYIYYNGSHIYRSNSWGKTCGFSVRCIKD